MGAKKPRDYSFDCLRIVAAFFVVLIHTSSGYWSTDITQPLWLAANLYDYLAHIAVPLFLMISGALFLSRPVLDLKRFITKNLFTIILILVVWCVFYGVASATKNFHDCAALFTAEGWDVFVAKTAEGKYHLWYLRAIIMIYLLVPIVHAAIHKTGVSVWYCTAAALLVAAPQIIKATVIGMPQCVDVFISGFYITYVPLVIYLLLGYALTQSAKVRNVPLPVWLVLWVLVTAGGVALTVLHTNSLGKADSWLFGNYTLTMLVQSCLFYLIFVRLGVRMEGRWKHGPVIQYLSGLTLGIYLLHPLVLAYAKELGLTADLFNPFASIPFMALVVFLVCGVIVALLRLIPGLKKVV